MSEQENNELIARFMGWSPDERYDKVGDYHIWTNPIGKNAIIGCNLNYNNDWNMLMTVINKIETGLDLGFNVVMKNDKCRIYRYKGSAYESQVTKLYEGDNKFTSTYSAVVEFIKWYNDWANENQKKNL